MMINAWFCHPYPSDLRAPRELFSTRKTAAINHNFNIPSLLSQKQFAAINIIGFFCHCSCPPPSTLASPYTISCYCISVPHIDTHLCDHLDIVSTWVHCKDLGAFIYLTPRVQPAPHSHPFKAQ